MVVIVNYMWIELVPRPLTTSDEHVQMIHCVSTIQRRHIGYIVAASPNPTPGDDVVYNDLA